MPVTTVGLVWPREGCWLKGRGCPPPPLLSPPPLENLGNGAGKAKKELAQGGQAW